MRAYRLRCCGGKLIHDLEAIFFNNWIGQNFFGDLFDLFLRFVARQPIEIQHEEFSLANFCDLPKTQASQRVVDCFPLGIEHGALWHYPDVSFHMEKYINSKAWVHAG